MHIFLQAVSPEGYICLFDNTRRIIAELSFELLGNESSKLIGLVGSFLRENHIDYTDIQNIATVVGPGSFTGIRTIVLFVNTISFAYPDVHLTSVNYFDLFQTYPIVKQSSKRDMFVKRQKNTIIEIMVNEDLYEYIEKKKLSCVYGHIWHTGFSWDIHSNINYRSYIKSLKLDTKKILTPLYIKKPNIT